MKTESTKAFLTELDRAIEYFYSKNYYLAAKAAIRADYQSSSLVNEPFQGSARMDSAGNTAMMIAMTTHGISEINSMDYDLKEMIYHSIQNQWLNEYHSVRDRILSESDIKKRLFSDNEYWQVATESISNTIINIIMGRIQLPYKSETIDKYCGDARLSNPYHNAGNWRV